MRANAAAQKFVKTQMRPADVMAVMASAAAGGVQVKQDFTADHDTLLAAIQQLSPPASGISAAQPGSDDAATAATDRHLAVLGAAVRKLAAVEGKKALIYMTGGAVRSGTKNQLQEVINAAVRANIAFFAVDTRGLVEK